MENEQIEIYLRKWYYFLLFLCAIIFVIGGVFIIFLSFFNEKIFTQEIYQLLLSEPFFRLLYNPVTEIITGILGILFFGFAAIVILRKIVEKKPGLIIDSMGITFPRGIYVRHIRWENITGIKSFNLIIVRTIIIIINNPNEYIECIKNIFLKIDARIDTKIMGSPISIPTDMLKCKHKELVNILQNELKKRKT